MRNVLNEKRFFGRVARRKHFISQINKEKRLKFAKEHLNKSDEFWNVIFTEESKFNICGLYQYVWRKANSELEPKNLIPTVKHGGGSVLVWGCMAANGVGNLIFVDEIMTATVYVNILRHNLKQSAQKLGLEKTFLFQQDNDPKHRARKTEDWLLYNAHRQLTPPPITDMNPIENLYLDQVHINKRFPQKNELKRILLQEWQKMTPERRKVLVSSMQRRLKAVILPRVCKQNIKNVSIFK